MSRKGLSMRKVREVLRLRFGMGLTARQVSRSLNLSHSTVSDYVRRARAAGISWPLPEGSDDAWLKEKLFGRRPQKERRPLPDMAYVYRELKRKHVTLELLWEEYKRDHPDGYQYTQFCELYRRYKKKIDLSLRSEYKAGEKMFVDYAGDTVPVVDPSTGEVRQASIFVAVLGASNYCYAEATLGQTTSDWISSHIRAFEFFGGVTEVIVPDNTKTAVKSPCFYEPDLNPIYSDLAAYYGTTVIPARVRKPRDKAKAEAGVLVVERWILAALRNRVFFGIEELNLAIRELLERLNDRKFKKLDSTRRKLYETLDKPALRPLPPERYPFTEWKTAKVSIDYHIDVYGHYYSVPHQLVGEQVDVRLGPYVLEVLWKNKRVASHVRSYKKGQYTTCPEHMPKSHQRYLQWTPSRLIQWAEKTGPNTARMVETILTTRRHPEQGYRSCLGIMRLSERYSPERVEAACRRCLSLKAYSYRSVSSVIKSGLDKMPPKEEPPAPPVVHENLRGGSYYRTLDPEQKCDG